VSETVQKKTLFLMKRKSRKMCGTLGIGARGRWMYVYARVFSFLVSFIVELKNKENEMMK